MTISHRKPGFSYPLRRVHMKKDIVFFGKLTDFLNRVDGTDFVESMTLDLSVYDAGTDSGARYTSADLVTAPASPIGLLTSDPADAPFLNGTPGLGQFVIQRLP